jgi:protein-S-isoprenylcysteine O-methyltransferase Ste14
MPLGSVTSLVGAVLILGGGLLAVRGLLDLGRNLTPTPRPKDDAELVEHGAYARVRHPVYGGLIVGAVGWGLVSASLVTLVLAALLAVVLDLKSRREEAWLRDRYPGYAAYAGRTRRLLPWLY